MHNKSCPPNYAHCAHLIVHTKFCTKSILFSSSSSLQNAGVIWWGVGYQQGLPRIVLCQDQPIWSLAITVSLWDWWTGWVQWGLMDESNPEHIGHVPRGQARSHTDGKGKYFPWLERDLLTSPVNFRQSELDKLL